MNDHTEYNLFTLSDMKGMAEVLRDVVLGSVVRLEGHGHMFSSALQFILMYKALASKEIEV